MPIFLAMTACVYIYIYILQENIMEEKGFSHTLQKTAVSCQYAAGMTYFCKLTWFTSPWFPQKANCIFGLLQNIKSVINNVYDSHTLYHINLYK